LKIVDTPVPQRIVFEHDEKGEIISLVELIILPDLLGRRPIAYIHKVCTDKQHQHQGLATKLMKQAIEKAEELNCYKLFLVCKRDIAQFYDQLGLRDDGEIRMVSDLRKETDR
jgi:GNAT superfamily N-acetyltransferase